MHPGPKREGGQGGGRGGTGHGIVDHRVDIEVEVRAGEGLAAAAGEAAAVVLEGSHFDHGLRALFRRGRYGGFMQDALLDVDGTNQLPQGR